MPLHMQPKLLTALEQRQVVPVGANKPVAIDVRVIAATNCPPEQLSDEGRFRQDLLFRLNTVEIDLPPLRERRGDIIALADHFIAQYARKYGKPARELPDDVAGALEAYDWPGNVRALRHACERAVILADGAFISADFSPRAGSRLADGAGAGPTSAPRQDSTSTAPKAMVEEARKAQPQYPPPPPNLGTRASLYRRWRLRV